MIKCVNEVQKKLFIVGWMVFDAYYAIFEYDVLSATGRELRLNKLITSPITAAAVEFHVSFWESSIIVHAAFGKLTTMTGSLAEWYARPGIWTQR